MNDCISRQAVLDIIDKWYPQKTPRMIKMISELPSVTPTLKECDDCISRQAAIDKAIYTETEEGWSGWTVDVKHIECLPSVTPTERTGHWIEKDDWIECSLCSCLAPNYEFSDAIIWKKSKFCPNCGARMVEGSDTE